MFQRLLTGSRALACALLVGAAAPAAAQETIAYWAQNDNDLPGGGFGFTPDSFPQPADVGTGFLLLADFDESTGADGVYTGIQSFAGNSANALPGFAAGGSLSPQGGAGTANNGMSIELVVDTTGHENLRISWAQRGTATGFDSRTFSWSLDGENFQVVDTDTGVLGSSWQVRNIDLSGIEEIDDRELVIFRITLDGATSSNGNNRFDNILVQAESGSDPTPLACGEPATPIHQLQGSGFASPLQGQAVDVEAIVTGTFQSGANGGLAGFYLQQADADRDDDPATSEGVFVFDNGTGVDVVRGDRVRVAGSVTEFFGETQVANVSAVEVCASGQLDQVNPSVLSLPADDLMALEALEGMWVVTDQTLTVNDVFNAVRFGEVLVSAGRRFQPTQVALPGADAQALQAANDRNAVIIDDARDGSNRTPMIPGGDNVFEVATDNPIRNGYEIAAGFQGFLGYGFDAYRVQPLERPEFVPTGNPRGDAPMRAGNLRVASFNAGNLFNTLAVSGNTCGPNALSCRGARTASERQRQLDKLVAAISGMDADLLALSEVENDADDATLAILTAALNAAADTPDWQYLATGWLGTDAIKPAFLYRAGRVQPEGPYAVLDSSVDPDFDTSRQRPALAQTFRAANSGKFTAVVVHLRAKGSCPSDPSDPNADQGDGQACWNLWRTLSTAALADWLDGDPTGGGDDDVLILGDFNSYALEDPLAVLADAGYANLATAANGGDPAYSGYTFFGQAGALDHALASPSLAGQALTAGFWAINADEIPVFDYTEGTLPGGFLEKPESFYQPDPYRASDHDPLVIDLDLTPCAPGIVNRPGHPRGKPLPLPSC